MSQNDPRDETRAHREVTQLLDLVHESAAAADGDVYFDLFEPDARFIGTDARERWTLAQFRAYARPIFESGRGWTYDPTERDVRVHGDVAWFDERLHHARYGEMRGSGVCRRGATGTWRVAQYVLSFPVPNDVALDVVEVIANAKAQ